MTARFLAPLLLLVGLALWISGPFSRIPPSPILRPRSFHLPVYFIKNQGQAPPEVAYYVQGRHAGAWFTPSAVYYTLRKPGPFRPASTSPDTVSTVQLFFERANPDARLETGAPAAAQVSYFRGPREQWRTGLPTYSSVVYRDLWPGIDLEFAGPDGNLKYTFHVRPGADPRQIQLAYRGAYAVSLTPRGSLHIATPAGDFVDDQPLAWQQTSAGRKPVTAGFRLDGEQVRFQLGAYDPTLPLTIDPAVLLYSGYLGGGADDLVQAIAVDTAGNAYVVGNTQSTQSSFPVSGGPDLTHNSGGDGFVAKVNPTGTALLYVGYIGGNGDDLARSIAVDPAGNAYISGYTNSTQATFPVLVGPDLTHNGAQDAFVAKLNPAGTALVYCGYVGGANDDFAFGLAVDASGSAHFIGPPFPTSPPFRFLSAPTSPTTAATTPSSPRSRPPVPAFCTSAMSAAPATTMGAALPSTPPAMPMSLAKPARPRPPSRSPSAPISPTMAISTDSSPRSMRPARRFCSAAMSAALPPTAHMASPSMRPITSISPA